MALHGVRFRTIKTSKGPVSSVFKGKEKVVEAKKKRKRLSDTGTLKG